MARPGFSGYDYLIKLLVIGDSGVGKTCLLLRFADDTFTTSHLPTIGVDFKIKTIEVDGKQVKLQIWDTAGQERYKTITQTYYKGAMGIVIAYDCTDEETYNNVTVWMQQVQIHADPDVKKVLLANKCDRPDRKISVQQGEALARELGLQFFETSAKSNINVMATFQYLAKEVMGAGTHTGGPQGLRLGPSVPEDLEALMDEDDKSAPPSKPSRVPKHPKKSTKSQSILESLFPEQSQRAKLRLGKHSANAALARLVSTRKKNKLVETSILSPGQVLRVKNEPEKFLKKQGETPSSVETVMCEIWKQEVAYCTKAVDIAGELTLTQYFLMFEPTLSAGFATVHTLAGSEFLPSEQCHCCVNIQDIDKCDTLRLPARKLGQENQHLVQLRLSPGLSERWDIGGIVQFAFRIKSEGKDKKMKATEKHDRARELARKINQYRGMFDCSASQGNSTVPFYDIGQDDDCDADTDEVTDEVPTHEDSASSIPLTLTPNFLPGKIKFTEPIDSHIISEDMQDALARELPKIYQLRKWRLVFAPCEHGCSIRVLYRNACDYGATLLLVIDETKTVFGGFVTEPLRVTKKFYGTGEGFLFTFGNEGKLRVFRPTFLNEYYVTSDLEAIMLGLGGGTGLYIAKNLVDGSTHWCDTYGNNPLSSLETFKILNLELWGFV